MLKDLTIVPTTVPAFCAFQSLKNSRRVVHLTLGVFLNLFPVVDPMVFKINSLEIVRQLKRIRHAAEHLATEEKTLVARRLLTLNLLMI